MQSTEVATETWLPIPGFEGSYEVSDYGGVRSLDRTIQRSDGLIVRLEGRMLAIHIHNGYPTIRLAHGNRRLTFGVHRLVLLAFVGPSPDGMEACHNDGDRSNNVLSNLRWDSRSENNKDRIRHGTDFSRNKTTCPRGHRLESPNLIEDLFRRTGYRSCRACNLALQHGKYRGEPFDPAVADAKYSLIIAGANPIRPKRKRLALL